MTKKILVIFCLIAGVVALSLLLGPAKKPLSSPLTVTKPAKEAAPSETLKEYTDPAGFNFSYPDNLSLIRQEIEDNETYADLQLSDKEVNGSLNLKITDSRFKTLDDWTKMNKGTIKEVNLGNLKALEVRQNDRILLGALDQSIFFSIEMPLVEEKFWMKVYEQVLLSLSFVLPEVQQAAAVSDDVAFEGEEVVE